MGNRAGVGQTVLVHYRPQNREAIAAACLNRVEAVAGVPGLVLEVNQSARPKGGGQADGKTGAGAGSSSGIASRAARAR